MMDALKFLNEKARMCESVTIESCPLRRYVLNCCDCGEITNAEMAVLVVEEWSKAHPIQTNGMKLKKDFSLPSVEKVFNAGRWMYALPEEWWNAPYEAPKGADK